MVLCNSPGHLEECSVHGRCWQVSSVSPGPRKRLYSMRSSVWGWLRPFQSPEVHFEPGYPGGRGLTELLCALGSWLALTRGMGVAVGLQVGPAARTESRDLVSGQSQFFLHTCPLLATGSSFPRNWEREKCMSGELVTPRFSPALLEVRRALLVLECQFLWLVSQLLTWNTDLVGTTGFWRLFLLPQPLRNWWVVYHYNKLGVKSELFNWAWTEELKYQSTQPRPQFTGPMSLGTDVNSPVVWGQWLSWRPALGLLGEHRLGFASLVSYSHQILPACVSQPQMNSGTAHCPCDSRYKCCRWNAFDRPLSVRVPTGKADILNLESLWILTRFA